MYESFFRFTSRPFVAAPLVNSYFASESAEAARQTLTRAIDRAEGPGLILGPAGVGKTLLCRLLAARFQDSYQVAMLSSTRILTRKTLLQNILFELGQPYRNLEEGELRLSLLDYLQPHEDCPHGVLLIVDEAHSLPLRLLEEIRMITNLVRDGQPRVRLVLAGNSKLEEKFASAKLESFNQRIAARCYLEPFGRDDTIDYVLTRVAAVGGNADALFDEGALRAVYQATDGIPRLINQVCDHALVMAFAGGQTQIDAAGVEEAWADLQQLPGPWHDSPQAAPAETTIEFGELDSAPALVDDDGDSPETLAAPTSAAPPMESSRGQLAFEAPLDEPLDSADSLHGADESSVAAKGPTPVADPFGDGFDEEEVVIDQVVIKSAEVFARRTRVVSREGRELAASMTAQVQTDTMLPESESVLEACDQHGTAEYAQNAVELTDADVAAPASERLTSPLAGPINADVDETEAAQDWLPQAAYGMQMFEYTAFEPNDVADLALEALCDVNVALGDLEREYDATDEPMVKLMDQCAAAASDENADDRAIIVTDHDEPASPSATPEGSVHRVEYQTLFAQLRHG